MLCLSGLEQCSRWVPLTTGILKWLHIIFNGAKYRQEPAAPGISLVPPLKAPKLRSEMELSQELKRKK